MKQGRKTEPKAFKEARLQFYADVLGTSHLFRQGCWFSKVVSHKCDGEIHPCHVIDKQGLRTSGELWLPPEEIPALMYDKRNGVPGCEAIHGRFDRHGIRIYQDDLPESVFLFIDEWEERMNMPGHLQVKLDKKCPKGARP